jgi:hypothetical protein
VLDSERGRIVELALSRRENRYPGPPYYYSIPIRMQTSSRWELQVRPLQTNGTPQYGKEVRLRTLDRDLDDKLRLLQSHKR